MFFFVECRLFFFLLDLALLLLDELELEDEDEDEDKDESGDDDESRLLLFFFSLRTLFKPRDFLLAVDVFGDITTSSVCMSREFLRTGDTEGSNSSLCSSWEVRWNS